MCCIGLHRGICEYRDGQKAMRCLCGAPNCVGLVGAAPDDNDEGQEQQRQYPAPIAVTTQAELNMDELYRSAIEAVQELLPSAVKKLLGRSQPIDDC